MGKDETEGGMMETKKATDKLREQLNTCPICDAVDDDGLEACAECYSAALSEAGKLKSENAELKRLLGEKAKAKRCLHTNCETIAPVRVVGQDRFLPVAIESLRCSGCGAVFSRAIPQ